MSSKDYSLNFMQGVEAFGKPAQCLNDIVRSLTEYGKILEEEKTRRRKIDAWENANLAEIKAKRDFLISYLEHSFDERDKNFQSLFQVADQAIFSGDNQRLSLAIHAIVELAKSSPFKDFADLSTIKAALDDPEHVWEL